MISVRAAANDHFEVFRWAREQDPPCPLWQCESYMPIYCCYRISPRLLVHLAQQQAPLLSKVRAQAHISAAEMAHAFLSLTAALPDKTPHEVVLSIVSLALSDKLSSSKLWTDLTSHD